MFFRVRRFFCLFDFFGKRVSATVFSALLPFGKFFSDANLMSCPVFVALLALFILID